MARLRCLVLPGHPYHVTQRGNRRSPTFFEDGDYELYRDLLGEAARRAESEIWELRCQFTKCTKLPDDNYGASFTSVRLRLCPFAARR